MRGRQRKPRNEKTQISSAGKAGHLSDRSLLIAVDNHPHRDIPGLPEECDQDLQLVRGHPVPVNHVLHLPTDDGGLAGMVWSFRRLPDHQVPPACQEVFSFF